MPGPDGVRLRIDWDYMGPGGVKIWVIWGSDPDECQTGVRYGGRIQVI
jgi:hypothetical protein